MRDLVAQGCAIVLTTHYLEEAEALANRVAGKITLAGGELLALATVMIIGAVPFAAIWW